VWTLRHSRTLGERPDDGRRARRDGDRMNAFPPSHRLRGLLVLAAAATTLCACGSQHADKSGATDKPGVTLTLAMPDQTDALGSAFADAVARHSHGSVRVKLDRGAYTSTVPANELRLAQALEAGRADIAYLPARAWSAMGIGEFTALLAPFVVTTDEAAQTVASGQIARDVLAALPDRVVGLALVPAETRRVLAVRPPLSPEAFSGLRLRVVDNRQSAAVFEALGARAVQGLRSDEVTVALQRRRLDGAETAPTYALGNGYLIHARHLSGYGVFPNFESIVLSRNAWDRLSGAQQAAVRAAAQETVAAARTAVAAQERSDLGRLCAAGTRIAVPTAAQLRELATAAEPAAEALASDLGAARVLAAIRALPGAGPRALAAPLPTACTSAAPSDGAAPRRAPATIPNGTYITKVTAAQWRAAGATNPDLKKDITYTTLFEDGRWSQTQTPSDPDQCPDVPTPSHPACNGTYTVRGDELRMVWSPSHVSAGAPETVRWSYFDGVLRFEPIDVADTGSRAMYAQPWRKVR
jgi:TRAP-type C4-dicarboxylate transport system substrate-binding protein